MLARKISASSGASAGRNGRIPSFGCARALMIASPLRRPARSSLHLPDGGAVLLVLELDAHGLELVADAVGVPEIPGLARGVAGIDERDDLVRVDVALAFGPPRKSKRPQR